MTQALKSFYPLLISLIVFVAFKIPHLHYAYYWDECWPYAVAIKELYRQGISLMPNAIDAEISRGHPLFFHAMGALWMHVFGDSRIAMHSLALLISVLFLVAIYVAGLRLFNIRVATMALLLTATMEMFVVQSAMVLFEVLVAFLCFLSIVFYAREKYLLTSVCLSMLFYTKESGMVLGAVLGIHAFILLFRKDTSWKQRIAALAAVGVPCILIGIYFLIQKQVRGWYIFPFYAYLVPHTWKHFWYDLRMNSIRATFVEFLKFYDFILLILLTIIAAIKTKQMRLLTVLLPAICIYYFVDDMRAGRLLPSVPFFIVFVGSVCVFLYTYANRALFPDASQRKLIVLTGFFDLAFLCFSGMNFFTPRYMMAAIIPLFFITSAIIDKCIRLTWHWLYYPAVVAILAISASGFAINEGYGDCDMGAFDGLKVHQGVVDYFEKNIPYDANVCIGSFLERQHLINPATGFLRGSRTFSNVTWECSSDVQYAVFDNIEPDTRHKDFFQQSNFKLIRRIQSGRVWAEIYQRK